YLPANFDPSQQNTYGFLWVPATSSAQGYAEVFVNGQQVGPTYTWNQGGPYSSIDANRLQVILGTGSTNPMTVYNVQVRQGAGANDIGNFNTDNTPSTPIQTPPTIDPVPAPQGVVTGSGPDSLVLKICEDAFANHDGTSDAAGDATFTVSIDGKQLGGT